MSNPTNEQPNPDSVAHASAVHEPPLVLAEQRSGGITIITLNDPDRRNAMTAPMVDQLVDAVADFESDPDQKCLIVTGTPPAFCAGADLAALSDAGSVEDSAAGLRSIYRGFLAVAACTKPVLAAVNGAAVGAGMNLALAADVCVTSPNAMFDTRFAALGIHPGGGHTWMLQQRLGANAARAMLLFGERVDGDTAVEIGLAYRCVPEEHLMDESVQLAAKAAKFQSSIVADIKRTMAETLHLESHHSAVERELVDQARSVRSEEFRNKLARPH